MIFYILNLLILFSSLIVVLSTNVITSIFFLIIDFLLVAFLCIYIGATFLSFMIIMVYVGAVTVLFLFVIMLLDVRYVEYYKLRYSLIFCILIAMVIIFVTFSFQSFNYLAGYDFLGGYMKSYNNFSNIVLIGYFLYNYYYLHVVMLSILLLAGMLGIINLLQKKVNFYYSFSRKIKWVV